MGCGAGWAAWQSPVVFFLYPPLLWLPCTHCPCQQEQPKSKTRLGRISLRNKQTKAEVQTKQRTRAKHIHMKPSGHLQPVRELPLLETLGNSHPIQHPPSNPKTLLSVRESCISPHKLIFCGVASLSSITSHSVSLRQPVPNTGTKSTPSAGYVSFSVTRAGDPQGGDGAWAART